MENTWQTAKRSLLVEEAKKWSDAVHAYSLEIGKRRTKPPPVELQQYLILPYRTNAYKLLRQRETGVYLTTGRKEMLIHSIESYWNPVDLNHKTSKTRKCLISFLIVANYQSTVGRMSIKLFRLPLKTAAPYYYQTLINQKTPRPHT